MNIENLKLPRYKIIADYPNSHYKIDQIIHEADNLEGAMFFKSTIHNYPKIFKPLEWWEHRTLDEMMSVEYVRITIYTGYWIISDDFVSR